MGKGRHPTRRRVKEHNKTRDKCPTRKIRFDTEYEADRSIKHFTRDDVEVVPTRSYYCPMCDGFHLTKSEYRGPSVAICGSCGVREAERHELSCETVSPEEFFARTGGRRRQEGTT